MKVGVGFVLPSGNAEMPPGPELLTGDTNILNVNLVLQYVIRDPSGIPVPDQRYSPPSLKPSPKRC